MSMSTADRQMIPLAIVFVCLISSSFEAKINSRAQELLADLANCGSDEKKALDDIVYVCAPKKWHYLTEANDQCCFWMNAVCANSNYMRDECSPKSDFEQKVKDSRNKVMALCAQNWSTPWSESLCDSGKPITDDCQQYQKYLDCKDISAGLWLRYPAVTELLLVALLIKYLI